MPTAEIAPDKAAFLAVIENWRRAFENRDLAALTADYAPDAVLFDVKPPYRLVGIDAIRKTWQHALPCFPKQFKSEHRDLHIEIAGDLAFIFGLHHITSASEPNHPACGTYLRITACFKKINGHWKAIHEHVSLPVDPATGKMSPIPDASIA